MKTMIRRVDDHGVHYNALMFVCPGCVEFGGTGIHILPVNTMEKKPAWAWDNNLDAPTINPSILTGRGTPNICHSYLREGKFEFLDDCTHSLAGQKVEMPELPDWIFKENEN